MKIKTLEVAGIGPAVHALRNSFQNYGNSDTRHGRVGRKDMELSDRLGNTAAEYAKLVSDAEGLISRLERQRHRQVLTLRYIEGRPWKAISDIMGYQDEKSVFRVHGWALKAAQQLLDGGKD